MVLAEVGFLKEIVKKITDRQIRIKEIGLSIPNDRKIKSNINPKLITILLIMNLKKIFNKNIKNKNRGMKKITRVMNVAEVKDSGGFVFQTINTKINPKNITGKIFLIMDTINFILVGNLSQAGFLDRGLS